MFTVKNTQRYVFKLGSGEIRKANYNLTTEFSFKDGLAKNKIISVGDSQLTEFVDRLNDSPPARELVKKINCDLRGLQLAERSTSNKSKISKLYSEIRNAKLMTDLLLVIMDNSKDYKKLNSGFSVNGTRYKRLVSTTGGIKESTVLYCNEKLVEKLDSLLQNGKNDGLKYIPAKYEAYKSLVCSTSVSVDNTTNVLVVNDCYTKFKEPVLLVSDFSSEEPIIEEVADYEINLNSSDGFGLISPEFLKVWEENIGETGITGVCVRNSFCKGMLYPFNFKKFSRDVANNNMVVDAWGNKHNILDIDLVLTTSMLKLWDSYDSIEHYLVNCEKNGYSFRVTKTFTGNVHAEKRTNYQFLQSLHLSKSDICELLENPIKNISDILQDDVAKTLIYLCGENLNSKNYFSNRESYIKALMCEPTLINDPFVRNKIKRMIKKRINELKFGRIPLRSNFMPLSGDPYALCQSMFGLTVTGILGKHEYYSSFWNNIGSNEVACFRAPMSCHNNIRIANLVKNDSVLEWYKYMDGIFILNAWDSTMIALNGCDFDGDLTFTTDDETILRSICEQIPLVCPQRQSEKKIVTEKDIVDSNVATFGNKIGQITNRITTMEDLKSKFPKNSKEWLELDYRIKCGQLFQQNEIDKAKGIISKPMPKKWYDKKSILPDDLFNLSIVADKRPYFMIYTNQQYMQEYNKYVSNKDRSCQRLFGVGLEDFAPISEQEKMFASDYAKFFPVTTESGVMNTVCRIAEEKTAEIESKFRDGKHFNYSILKSGTEYSKPDYIAIEKIVKRYWRDVEFIMMESKRNKKNKDSVSDRLSNLCQLCKEEILSVNCDNNEVCDIVLDVCYLSEKSKQFVWETFGEEIVENLLEKKNRIVKFPIQNEFGNINYNGKKFSMCECEVFYN